MIGYNPLMPNPPMIPPRPQDGRSEFDRFDAFTRKILSVPKAEIDAAAAKELKVRKQPKSTHPKPPSE